MPTDLSHNDTSTNHRATPSDLGYRMPAEWHPHAATWLSWPRPDCISFPSRYKDVIPTLARLVNALTPFETVNINVGDIEFENDVKKMLTDCEVRFENVRFYHIPTNEPWCRDHGPTFLIRNKKLAVVDWDYNSWGGKYLPCELDNAVPQQIADTLGLQVFRPGIVMEGGSIDVNGSGSLLTTTSCLLNQNRNPHLTKKQIEKYLCDYLGVTNILWLSEGIAGDDTDGHIDDLSRFTDPTTIVTAIENNKKDVNYEILQNNRLRLCKMRDENGHLFRIVDLPMPKPVRYKGERLPASYANFYIANEIVVVPTYRDKDNDGLACEVLTSLFPDRKIINIDSTDLIWGLGSFHCLTQQQPKP